MSAGLSQTGFEVTIAVQDLRSKHKLDSTRGSHGCCSTAPHATSANSKLVGLNKLALLDLV